MANYATLKAAIQDVVRTNGNNEITGALLQQTLLTMVTSLGTDYQFVGIATTSTNPGTPDQNVFYIAGPGEYSNFNAATVPDGFIGVFKYNGSWTVQTVAVGKNYDAQIHKVGADADQLIAKSLYENTFVQGVTYELGNITITGTNWVYSNSQSRVRTPEGYFLHLFPGDKIGLSNYSNARFYVGYIYLDGTGGAQGWLTSDYTVLKEGNFCVLVCNTVDTPQTSADALGSLIQIHRNTTISKQIGNLEKFQEGISLLTESDLTLYQDNKYFARSGVIVSSSAFKIYSYAAKRGDYIYIYANNSTSVSTLGKDVGQSACCSLVVGMGGFGEYRYIVDNDETIYISINKSATYKILIIRNKQYAELLSVNTIPLVDIEKYFEKQRGYIKFSDGSFNSTASNIFVYSIPAAGLSKIKVYVTAGDDIPAAIAFYSSDTIQTANYLGGVQIIQNTGGGRWYETTIPANCQLICVTNHFAYVAKPYILVDVLLKSFLGIDEGVQYPELGVGIVYGYQKAANYDGQFAPLYTLNSYFPQSNFQEKIRNTPLYGVRLNPSQVGTFTIAKATGVNTDNCVMTTIKTFTITKTGWQVLLFDAPVILNNNESIGFGVRTDTAKLVIDSVYGGANAVMTDYLHYTLNTWQVYQQNMLVDVLGIPRNDVVDVSNKVATMEKMNVFAGNNPFRFTGPFYAHLFLDKIYENSTNITVPSESLEDIRISKRLGFNVIEANVQMTSDGKFVVIHGAGGKFGYEVTDLNGAFTYADTAINSVTLDWIKANIRYRSDLPRFRTQIPTLEEFLTECRIQGMVPFSQASTAAMVALLDNIMGYGNYIAYNGTRALTQAPIVQYLSLATKAEIMERARSIGVPYIYAMANLGDFTDEELADIVHSLHAEGFMIGTAYVSGMAANRVRKLGFDLIASTWNINDFDNANICTLCNGLNWDDFAITGATPTDSGVSLSSGQTIAPATAPNAVFLAKAVLHLTFSGELYVSMGSEDAVVSSDGVNEIQLSSYFINSAPTFQISGRTAGATITDIVFKASKC